VRGADGVEREHTCAWLVGCGGAHSIVRHGLGLNFAGAAENADWILADLHIDGGLPRDEVSIHFHPDGVLALFPIPPDRFRIIVDLDPTGEPQPAEPTLAEVQALIDRRGPGGLTVRDPVWMSCFRINDRQVPTYRIGRVFLAGDAAHVHSPAGGQGMNSGMQEAFTWRGSWRWSSRGERPPRHLPGERHPVGAMIVRGAAGAARRDGARGVGQRLRDFVLQTVYQIPQRTRPSSACSPRSRSTIAAAVGARRRSGAAGRCAPATACPICRCARAACTRGCAAVATRCSFPAPIRPSVPPSPPRSATCATSSTSDLFGEDAVASRGGWIPRLCGPARVENVLAHLDSYLIRAA
jgi:hypothetical protein